MKLNLSLICAILIPENNLPDLGRFFVLLHPTAYPSPKAVSTRLKTAKAIPIDGIAFACFFFPLTVII